MLWVQADGIHLTAEAQEWLGCRLAEVLKSHVFDKAESGCIYAQQLRDSSVKALE